jgi:putative tricarboxylic transport membrane protein
MVALAVSGNRRIPGVDVPTLTELGVPVTAANWRGVFAPPGISADQRAALTNFMTQVHASAAWKQELETRKWTDVFLSGDAFGRDIEANIAATEGVMKDLGLA